MVPEGKAGALPLRVQPEPENARLPGSEVPSFAEQLYGGLPPLIVIPTPYGWPETAAGNTETLLILDPVSAAMALAFCGFASGCPVHPKSASETSARERIIAFFIRTTKFQSECVYHILNVISVILLMKKFFGLDANRWGILIVIMLTVLIASLDQTVVATAMPTIVNDLGGLDKLSLVFAAYMTASLITVTISGKLGDMFGRKKLYLYGIALFTLGSFLCGFSQNMDMLITFRALQGAGAGMLMVLSMAMMGDLFTPRERGKWISLIAAIYGLASIFGPMLGAAITQAWDWRWVFYVNVPIGILTIFLMRRTEYKQAALEKGKPDFAGCILFTIFIISFMAYAQMGIWPLSAKMVASFLLMLVALFFFARQESKAPEAILPPFLFKNSIFITSIICAFILNAALFGVISFVPQYVETILGGGPMDAGKALTPLLLSAVLSMVLVGQITSRTGKYKLIGIISVAIACIGIYMLSSLQVGSSYNDVLLALTILGIGLGPPTYLYTLIVQNAFASAQIGIATSGVTFFRNLGSALGVTLIGAVINFVGNVTTITTEADRVAYVHGLQTAFMLSFALSLICVFLMLTIKEIPLRTKRSSAAMG